MGLLGLGRCIQQFVSHNFSVIQIFVEYCNSRCHRHVKLSCIEHCELLLILEVSNSCHRIESNA